MTLASNQYVGGLIGLACSAWIWNEILVNSARPDFRYSLQIDVVTHWRKTTVRPHWVDHSLEICVLNAKNVKGIPFPMYGIFYLTTFLSIHDSKF